MRCVYRLIFVFIVIFGANANASEDSAKEPERMRVLFINPEIPQGRPFWDLLRDFMLAAAKSLDIDLHIEYAQANRFLAVKLAQKAFEAPVKPHYIVHIYHVGQGRRILSLSDQHQVSSFTINTGIPAEEKKYVKAPREHFRHWIGHMLPDDVQAGYKLAQHLIADAEKKKLYGPGGKIEMVALSGSRDSTVAHDRNSGLMEVAYYASNVVLHQVIFAEWIGFEAARKTSVLLERYPYTSVVWAASDEMALGIAEGVKAYDRRPGQDMVLGGVDGMDEALDAIEQGTLSATLVGHFLEGAWALVLLYDHFHGIDFADQATVFRIQFTLVTKENVGEFASMFEKGAQNKVDFRRFSRAYQRELKEYNFTVDEILKDL